MTDSKEESIFEPCAGPCFVCGATNYSLSMGGPTICPSCDCGIHPVKQLKEVRNRILELEVENQKLRDAIEKVLLLEFADDGYFPVQTGMKILEDALCEQSTGLEGKE